MNYLHIMGQHNFIKHNGELLYTEALSPCIQTIAQDSMFARYRITSPNCPPETFFNESFGDIREFVEAYRAKGYVSMGGNFSRGDTYLLFSYYGSPKARYCFHDIKTGISHNFKSIDLSNDTMIENFSIIPSDEGYVGIVIPASEICGKTIGERSFQNLKESDNPVICIGKIK